MILLDWNIQWCRGMDGRVEPERIAAYVMEANADVACFQEVAAGFPDLPGSSGENQIELLKKHLSGYAAFFGGAVDLPGRDGARKRFGNMIFSRLPVGRVLRHSLPWYGRPDTPSMPRGAIEVVIEAPGGALRVISTHLEYYSGTLRAAQVDRLGEIYREADHPLAPKGEGPFAPLPRPVSALVCGDFNLPPADSLHARMKAQGFVDTWEALHPGAAHPHTFHVFDEEEESYCCDYVFASEDVAPRLRAIRVDGASRASDHQPVIAEIE
ncbi:MAG TPA: endonuclease/exonuclease/phosphatase family protein [Burkholderiales bacterium]|nr:endonuclease/exonuclease/phosphatase family protein [Burkholderiales bacterium]